MWDAHIFPQVNEMKKFARPPSLYYQNHRQKYTGFAFFILLFFILLFLPLKGSSKTAL